MSIRHCLNLTHCIDLHTSRPDGAAKASQFLVLDGGSYDSVFQYQLDALENVRDLIYRHVNDEYNHPPQTSLYLQKRVFTKVSMCFLHPEPQCKTNYLGTILRATT